MIYFEILEDDPDTPTNTVKAVDWMAQNAYTLTLAVSLGQLRTLIENPGAMTHAALDKAGRKAAGIPPNAVRISIGIETPADIIRDLKNGLAVI
jgi:cystathionine beta-lyase/cystathionine gamma-synthase